MIKTNEMDNQPIDPSDWLYLDTPIKSKGVILIAKHKDNELIFLSEGVAHNVTINCNLGTIDGKQQQDLFDGNTD